jgi:hypothetical protein
MQICVWNTSTHIFILALFFEQFSVYKIKNFEKKEKYMEKKNWSACLKFWKSWVVGG